MSTPVSQIPDFTEFAGGAASPQPRPRVGTRSEGGRVDPALDSFVSDVMTEASRRTGYTYKLGEGLRTPEQQAQKVAAGYSRTYNSKHLTGLGRDVLAFDSSGRYITDGAHEAYKALGDVYRERAPSAPVRVKWGGDFKGFYDPGHFEIEDDGGAPASASAPSEPPDFDSFVASRSVPDFDEWVSQRKAADDEEVVRVNARNAVEPAAPAPPPLPQRQTLDPHTYQGRQGRDERERTERSPGAFIEVPVTVPRLETPEGGDPYALGSDLLREAYRRAVTARGVPAEFFDSHTPGYKLRDARGDEITVADAMNPDSYDPQTRQLRVRLDANHVSQIVDDYHRSQGLGSALRDFATGSDRSAGERALDVGGAALGTLKAVDAAAWAHALGADPATVGATAVMAADDLPTNYDNPTGDTYRAGADAVSSYMRAHARNPRAAALFDMLGSRIEQSGRVGQAVLGVVAQPLNLVPLEAAGELFRAGQLGRAVEEGGELSARVSKALRPLGLEAPAQAGHAPVEVFMRGANGTNYLVHTGTGEVVNLDTGEVVEASAEGALRSAGYDVRRVPAPNASEGGVRPDVWKVTGPDGNVNIMRDDAELSDFAGGVQAARSARAAERDALRANFDFTPADEAWRHIEGRLSSTSDSELEDTISRLKAERAQLVNGTRRLPEGDAMALYDIYDLTLSERASRAGFNDPLGRPRPFDRNALPPAHAEHADAPVDSNSNVMRGRPSSPALGKAPEGKSYEVTHADGRAVQYFDNEAAARKFYDDKLRTDGEPGEPRLIDTPKGARVKSDYTPEATKPELKRLPLRGSDPSAPLGIENAKPKLKLAADGITSEGYEVSPTTRRIYRRGRLTGYVMDESGGVVPDDVPPSRVEAIKYAGRRARYYEREAARLTDSAASANARQLADDYAAEAARLRRGEPVVTGGDGFDVAHHSDYQPRDGAGRFDGPPQERTAIDRALDVLGIPKALMASGDLSAPGRQGIVFLLTEPKASAGAIRDMLRAITSAGHENVVSVLAAHPKFGLARDSGLYLGNFGAGEEAFGGSIARRIPGVKVSDRTFETFLNSQRLRVFSEFADELAADGITPATHPDEYKSLASWINKATGRGDLGRLNKYSRAGNALMFSPRLAASRFQILSPTTYLSMTPAARKIALRKMLQFTGTLGGLLGAAHLAGADVTLDPRKSDFGKLTFGKTHLDLSGGNAYTVRFLTRFARSVYKAGSGERVAVNETPRVLATQFLRSKLSPAASLVADYTTGKTIEGEPFSWKGAAAERLLPLFVQDLTKAMREEGWMGAVHAAPSGLGFGVNTYGETRRRGSRARGR